MGREFLQSYKNLENYHSNHGIFLLTLRSKVGLGLYPLRECVLWLSDLMLMRLIKKLYEFILRSFLPLFAMTFFIVLFIVLMQFLWKYVDDMVGKGLSIGVLGELFFYAAVTMVPMALPLAILLASLMTFGNFGEKFELTAMKASGISLVKVMYPLIVFIGFISVGAFFFQNDILPKAQVKMWTLLFSVKQKTPEVEIPEGSFYDQIPGYNLFVKHKNQDTGMLYDVMIYDVSKGGDNSTILLADSARMAFTPDSKYLYLHLYQGEQFENLRQQSRLDYNVPFRRESFIDKQILIPFDANFNRLDEGGMRAQYVGKNITELRQTIDSVKLRVDSIGLYNARTLKSTALPLASDFVGFDALTTVNSEAAKEAAEHRRDIADKAMESAPELNIDSMIGALSRQKQEQVFASALRISQIKRADYEFRSMTIADEKKTIRRHDIELQKKFTLSLACLVFFFIGAPLGAIIRKGGIGLPLVISVLLFVVYYLFDNSGYKMARDGHWPVWVGIWFSTVVLTPLGIYLTYKAMNDSSVFDVERYKSFFRRIFGISEQRSVPYKEVIINDIDERCALDRLDALDAEISSFLGDNARPQGYLSYWLRGYDLHRIRRISADLDAVVDYLTDCRSLKVRQLLPEYPVITLVWALHPARRKWLSWMMIALFPLGLTGWAFGFQSQMRLKRSLRKVINISDSIRALL